MSIKTGRNTTPTTTPKTDDLSAFLPQTPVEEIQVETSQVKIDPIEHGFLLKYNISIADAPQLVQTIHERMSTYERKMSPISVIYSDAEGADNQLLLFNTFMRALGGQGNDLFMAVDVILAHINQYADGTYSSRMAYRYIKNIKRDQSEIDSYLKVLEIFLQIANPTGRVEFANSAKIRTAIATMDPRYKDAALALVTYLSQYKG